MMPLFGELSRLAERGTPSVRIEIHLRNDKGNRSARFPTVLRHPIEIGLLSLVIRNHLEYAVSDIAQRSTEREHFFCGRIGSGDDHAVLVAMENRPRS